jgi:hypothetical protein
MHDNESLKECGPAHYVEVFERFRQTKDPCEVADILSDDARITWSGLPEVAGSDYPDLLRHTSTELIPDMAIETVSHAQRRQRSIHPLASLWHRQRSVSTVDRRGPHPFQPQ